MDRQYFLGSRGKGWITDRSMTEKAKSPKDADLVLHEEGSVIDGGKCYCPVI